MVLEEQFPKHIERGMRPLATALSACRTEIIASQIVKRRSLNNHIQAADKSICNALHLQRNDSPKVWKAYSRDWRVWR
jgi:hypothetical protein